MQEKDELTFSITGKDYENVKKFQKQHKDCDCGFAGDRFEYSFVPSGLGMLGRVKCSCGQSLTLGSFMDYEAEDYDPAKYGVMTEDDLKNKKLEEVAELILNLKSPRLFRMSYMTDQSFELIADIALAMAVCTDIRLHKCIKWKYSTDAAHNIHENYVEMEDREKIREFFGYFEKQLKEVLDGYGCRNEHLLRRLEVDEEE